MPASASDSRRRPCRSSRSPDHDRRRLGPRHPLRRHAPVGSRRRPAGAAALMVSLACRRGGVAGAATPPDPAHRGKRGQPPLPAGGAPCRRARHVGERGKPAGRLSRASPKAPPRDPATNGSTPRQNTGPAGHPAWLVDRLPALRRSGADAAPSAMPGRPPASPVGRAMRASGCADGDYASTVFGRTAPARRSFRRRRARR